MATSMCDPQDPLERTRGDPQKSRWEATPPILPRPSILYPYRHRGPTEVEWQ
jgi:hypothetical protein